MTERTLTKPGGLLYTRSFPTKDKVSKNPALGVDRFVPTTSGAIKSTLHMSHGVLLTRNSFTLKSFDPELCRGVCAKRDFCALRRHYNLGKAMAVMPNGEFAMAPRDMMATALREEGVGIDPERYLPLLTQAVNDHDDNSEDAGDAFFT